VSRALGIGVIGLGFMGRTHLAAYRIAHARGLANRLVAVQDAVAERLSGRAGGGRQPAHGAGR
jgi:predicted dehydrogenase